MAIICNCTYEPVYCAIRSRLVSLGADATVVIKEKCPCYNCLVKMICTLRCPDRIKLTDSYKNSMLPYVRG
jgi:hypothetical protein